MGQKVERSVIQIIDFFGLWDVLFVDEDLAPQRQTCLLYTSPSPRDS